MPAIRLADLALRFYGSAHKWPKIHEANAGTLKNPHYIYIGQQLLIPADQPELDEKSQPGNWIVRALLTVCTNRTSRDRPRRARPLLR